MSPEDLQLLSSLCDPAQPVDFAARPELAAFLDRPEVQAQLAAILTIRDIRYHASLQAANTAAIATLQQVIAETEDLTEKRRAATSILRTVRSATSACHRGRLGDLGAGPRNATSNPGAPAAHFRAPAGLTSTPGAPPFHIPPHFKRINTFVYSETPARSMNARQAVANALALIQQGDSDSLQALFNHSTHRGRFGTKDADSFEPRIRDCMKDELGFQAAFAAPLVQTGRQSARQDVIIIPKSGEPAAFTIHLQYPMYGDNEYCWLIDRYTCRPPAAPPSPHESDAPAARSSHEPSSIPPPHEASAAHADSS